MNPLFWFVWLNEVTAVMLRRQRRRPVLRVIEGGRERGAPRLHKVSRMPVIVRSRDRGTRIRTAATDR
jgi:hypothetical protein